MLVCRPVSGYHLALSACHLAWVYRLVMWAYRLVWMALLSEASLWASKALEYRLAQLAAALGLPSALVGSLGWAKAAPFPVTE